MIELEQFEASKQSIIEEIVARQSLYFNVHGKYLQETHDGVFVTEYVGPFGAGFTIKLAYQNYRKDIDYGPENRNIPWHELDG